MPYHTIPVRFGCGWARHGTTAPASVTGRRRTLSWFVKTPVKSYEAAQNRGCRLRSIEQYGEYVKIEQYGKAESARGTRRMASSGKLQYFPASFMLAHYALSGGYCPSPGRRSAEERKQGDDEQYWHHCTNWFSFLTLEPKGLPIISSW